MITINNLSVQFNGISLFDNVSFTIGDKDRIGLVGKNGAGKSTLLKVISKNQKQDSGTIVVSSTQTIGYLPQEMIPSSTTTVIQEAMKAFEEIKQYKTELEDINNQLLERTDYQSKEYERLIVQQTELNDKLNMMDINNARPQAEKVLLGLGFVHEDFNRNMTEFSSGWQMRVELAKILLRKPNLILLDEPTNHLDIESITWLENFLIQYYGAIVLVSHDRCFLDNITKRTIEITAGKIYDYKANYSEYCVLHEQRMETQANQMLNQQRQIAEIEKFIERFRYKATKSRQVQSKIKMLDKMERIDVDEVDSSTIHFLFPPAPHSGKIVLEIKNLSKSYDKKNILKDINLIVERGEKIAFIGKNGEGKSTLSKIIIGQIKDYEGVCHLGYDVKIGYFAQNQAALLDGEKTVFETIDDIAVGDVRRQIRGILGSFLFDDQDIDKKVKVLSGGEKTRLALAKLLLSEVNLLVLDEPTNHLDMDSKDILKNALIKYDGSFILVSHDRDFLQGLTDKLYEFKNHNIKEYHGYIFDFLEAKKKKELEEQSIENSLRNTNNQDNNKTAISKNKILFEQNKEKEKELRKKRNRLKDVEQKIEDLEKEISNMDNMLSDTNQINKIDENFYHNYQNKKDNLSNLMQEWEDLSQELDN
ncbi:MAG: ATP-binding cassette domain-containing protein [Bacteroidales bacterium]|jgi:ATP-binding cassette subfamily F protein 3|nr:ATP-binding cassette domain-containing protein [Bacteroidales bacterium]